MNFNPNPASKLFLVLGIGFNLTVLNRGYLIEVFVAFLALFFFLNHQFKAGLKMLAFYSILFALSSLALENMSSLARTYYTLVIGLKFFILPLFAGQFLLSTSDLSSMLAAMDRFRVPKFLSIPIAIIFRYFPAFKEERRSIKLAMRMRGISFKNPLLYFEYVSIPILISATKLADDIAKSAECKCISDPVKKTRYLESKFGWIDLIFLSIFFALLIYARFFYA